MKKTILLMALAAIMLASSSCSNDDDKDTTSSTETTLRTPPYKNDAVRMSLPPNRLIVDGSEANVNLIELGESGTYLIAYQPHATRAADDTEYRTGSYTKNGNAYNLSGFATVTINGKSGTTYNIEVKTIDGTTTELNATAASGGVASGTMTDNLCRTWTIEKTRLSVTVEGITAAKEFPGRCDLNKLIDYAKERGLKIDDEVEENSIITGITFSQAGSFIISYQNGNNDVGKWNWSNPSTGALSYGWESAGMGNSLENGLATVSFTDGKCKLILGATIDNYPIQLEYTLVF